MNYVIVYHNNCVDGFCSAWIARNWFITTCKGGDTIDYLPMNHNEDYEKLGVADKLRGKHVFVFDFSFPRTLMIKYSELAKTFEVHDHHESAKLECQGLSFCTFDMNRSGAMLAWNRLFPDKAPPKLVEYVQDYDLWRHALPYTKNINAVINSYEKSNNRFDILDEMLKNDDGYLTLVKEGATILRLEETQIQSAIKYPILMDIGNYTVPVINNPNLISKTVEALIQSHPFAGAFFLRQDGKWVVSLRSRKGGVNVAAIAKQNGGGGYPGAAGFTLDLDELTGHFIRCYHTGCKNLSSHFNSNNEPMCELHETR